MSLGCGGPVDDPDDESTQRSSLTSETFTDADGWTWHKIGEVDEYVSSETEPPYNEDPEEEKPTIGDMTVEEVAHKYRPLIWGFAILRSFRP